MRDFVALNDKIQEQDEKEGRTRCQRMHVNADHLLMGVECTGSELLVAVRQSGGVGRARADESSSGRPGHFAKQHGTLHAVSSAISSHNTPDNQTTRQPPSQALRSWVSAMNPMLHRTRFDRDVTPHLGGEASALVPVNPRAPVARPDRFLASCRSLTAVDRARQPAMMKAGHSKRSPQDSTSCVDSLSH